MRRTFKLTFPTNRGDFGISVAIEKSYNDRISFRTGYRETEDDKPKLVKYIKVVPKANLDRISSRKHIAHVCTPNELLSLHPTGEEDSDGEDEYVVVDKTSLKNLFPGSEVMEVIRTVPARRVPFHYLTDKHYFLNVRKVKKNKKRMADPEDVAMYRLVWQGLKKNDEVLIVKYTAMNTNKHAVVYASETGLRITNMIASNYQKTREEKQDLEEDTNINLYNRLTKNTKGKRINLTDIKDDYALKLEELVQAALAGETVQPKKQEKYICFAKLASLAEDTEEEVESEGEEEKGEKPKRKTSRTVSGRGKKKKAKHVENSDSDSD